MDGASFGSYFQASKEYISGYIAKTCDYDCCFAFGRKVAPLVAGCVIGLLLAPVSPLIAGAFVVAGALWTGYLMFRPLNAYDIKFFFTSSEQCSFDIDMDTLGESETIFSSPMDTISTRLTNTTFVQVDNRDDLLRLGHDFVCFTDCAHGVTIRVCRDAHLCRSAQQHVENSGRVFEVCGTNGDGWTKHVGLNSGDTLLFVGGDSMLDQWFDDLSYFTEHPDETICFLKINDSGQPYLMMCGSHQVGQPYGLILDSIHPYGNLVIVW